jgi:hypothetical protein
LESVDKIGELFFDNEKRPVLRNKIGDLSKAYQNYANSRNLLSQSRKSHELIKKWLLRTIVILFLVAAWAAVGFLVENTFLITYSMVHWLILVPILLILVLFSIKIQRCYSKCCSIDNQITDEKAKHTDALGMEI